jgi:hypothetical protein
MRKEDRTSVSTCRANSSSRVIRTTFKALPTAVEGGRLAICLAHQIADNLANALVVEENGDPPGADVNGHPVTDDQGFGVIDLEAVAIDQGDGKRPEGRPTFESSQCLVEMICFHRLTPRISSNHV